MSSWKSVAEAFSWLESFYNSEQSGVTTQRTYRLERMEELCRLFENPQNSFKTIHVAGSKGKSSTSRIIAALLSETGLNVGLYTSPHLNDYRERITHSGNFFPDEIYIKALSQIQTKMEMVLQLPIFQEWPPSVFEWLTLAAFLIFKESNCDYAVIETGLGGRLDATNVILPRICVLTPIEKEHTEILGSTLPQIASEKGGIIKDNIPVQSADQSPQVAAVLNHIVLRKNSEINYISDSVKEIEIHWSLQGTEFSIAFENLPSESYFIPNCGDIFAYNATLAILTLRQLAVIDLLENCNYKTMSRALKKCLLPGRFQIIQENPTVIVDPAHTLLSTLSTAESFKKLIKGKRVLIFAAAADKDVQAIATSIGRFFHHIIITQFSGFKSGGGERDLKAFTPHCKQTKFIEEPQLALEEAKAFLNSKRKKRDEGGILIMGSFYLISHFLK